MKELELTTEEAVKYLKENVKIHDKIEISYNRIFAEGEVLNMDFPNISVNLALKCWSLWKKAILEPQSK